jgi:carboxyl-terminal processing protease
MPRNNEFLVSHQRAPSWLQRILSGATFRLAMRTCRRARCRRRLIASLGLLALAACGAAPVAPAADEQQTQLLEEAYNGIAKYYIEPVTPGGLALAGLRGLAKVDPTVSVEQQGDQLVLRQGGHASQFAAPASSDAQGWAALTEEVAAAARAQSPELAVLSSDGVEQTLLAGSMTLLDRFSHYSPPTLARERRAARDGFGGIGITLNAEGVDVRIVEVQPETPAASAGLRVNDRILAIDGREITQFAREDVVHRLRGPADSVVALEVARGDGDDRITFSVRRALIVPPSVVLTEEHGVALLRITSFNQQTGESLAELLRQAHRDLGGALRGIVLDLRGNPGGLLDQSVEVASQFLDGQPVTSTVGRVPESVQYFTAPHREVETLPLAVLVNGGSASASEVVAAALQDAGRAVVIGTASYGKGTVQNVQRMPNDGELTITWARLVAPGGYILHQHGVVPTVCTADLPDDAGGVATALARSAASPSAALARPRAKLDDAAWTRLRAVCPGRHEDHQIEVTIAEKLLADPALYAHALNLVPVAARPLATAGVVR